MKKKQKITKNAKSLTGMMLGVLAALVILFSQSFYFEYVASVEGEATKEQISDVDTDETVIKMAHQALSSIAQFAIQNVLHVIAHLYVENNTESEIKIENPVRSDSYFQTLFRLIISPNAP